MNEFKRREIFNEKCAPALLEIKRTCELYQIPFYFTACVEDNGEESVYITDAAFQEQTGVKLTDDRLKKHLLVGCGFDVVPKRKELEVILPDPDAL